MYYCNSSVKISLLEKSDSYFFIIRIIISSCPGKEILEMSSSEYVWKIHSYFHHHYTQNNNNIKTTAILMIVSTTEYALALDFEL